MNWVLIELLIPASSFASHCLSTLCHSWQMSISPEAIAAAPPVRNAPWIGEFSTEDGNSMYFIFVEQKVLCSVNSFVKSLFIWFSLFYNMWQAQVENEH